MVQELAAAVGGVAVHGGPIRPRVGAGVATRERGPGGGPGSLGTPSPGCLLFVLAASWPSAPATATAAARGSHSRRGALSGCGVAARRAVDEVIDEILGHAGIAGVSRRHRGVGDDL